MEDNNYNDGRTYHLVEQRTVPRKIDEVFAYAANFANSQDWDPGVESAVQMTDGPIGTGTTFDLTGNFGPGKVKMSYQITEFEPTQRGVLHGSGKGFKARDEMTFESVEEGTLINYIADITLTNALRYLGPLLNGSFRRMGEKALDGLAQTLSK
jgi:carbon monoxide dehydrogenase subunit G